MTWNVYKTKCNLLQNQILILLGIVISTVIQGVPDSIPGYILEIYLKVLYRVWIGVHQASWGQLGSYWTWEVAKSG